MQEALDEDQQICVVDAAQKIRRRLEKLKGFNQLLASNSCGSQAHVKRDSVLAAMPVGAAVSSRFRNFTSVEDLSNIQQERRS